MDSKDQSQAELRRRLEHVHEQIAEAALRVGRRPNDVTLVAVSKTHPAQTIQQATAIGVTDLGENRVQEAETKIPEVGRQAARWHLIGHLQSNKARRAVELFDVIHSLDSVALVQRLAWQNPSLVFGQLVEDLSAGRADMANRQLMDLIRALPPVATAQASEPSV